MASFTKITRKKEQGAFQCKLLQMNNVKILDKDEITHF